MREFTVNNLRSEITFDFNKKYNGYYEPCRFTAAAYVNGAYWIAGIDECGDSHLFTSFDKENWEETSLIAVSAFGTTVSASSEVVSILGEEEERQLYLICRNGNLVILPDCPKCIRIKKIKLDDGTVIEKAELITSRDKEYDLGYIRLFLSSGGTQEIPLSRLRQYRVSVSFAKQQFLTGAVWIDVREKLEESKQAEHIFDEMTFTHIPFHLLEKRLKLYNNNRTIIFSCETGRLADDAAEFAHKRGFKKAYSIGGTEKFMHIE